MQEDLSQKILTDIKDQKIITKPRWEFLLKDYLIWFMFVIAVVIGSLAIAVIIFEYRHNALSLLMKEFGISQSVFDLPYFWLLILLIFILIAYYNFQHTKQGYKYSVYVIFFASILMSVIFGWFIYYFKGGEQLEQAAYNHLPFYQRIMDHRGRIWLAPEAGRLAGVVDSEIFNEENLLDFRLRSFTGDTWNISCDGADQAAYGFLRPGIRVILIGKPTEKDHFFAEQILPWFAPKERMKKMHLEIDEIKKLNSTY